MKIDNLDKLKEDNELFEKILLAYWYSVPSDSDRSPDKVKLITDYGKHFNTQLIKDDIVYGFASITKYEIEKYIEKLRTLKSHEDDITARIDKEGKDAKK